ncbi:hypothetical protein GALMADRAFT_235186 [Galerina marginata CBS 339.88]|uniref:BTB domain-containing protein n=1 Tax=Galerina marginata (strain CBS 339.88) TaxID=685588 RepID=A0A067TS20_GALM3|nr:hypothetical protein GALMADRAFT_235186 [Galerina marginata CBS 339.88]
MFNIPQPETEPLFEGCPLVHLSDAPKDWENIFSILYDNNASYTYTDQFALPLLASMLRLGRKYQFDDMQAQALRRIRRELPDSLAGWDENFSDGAKGLVIESDHEIDLVNILVEMGIQSLLPMAYFLCIKSLAPVDILRGYTRDDDSTCRLSTETIEKLILARDLICKAILGQFEWAKTPSSIPTPGCYKRYQCEGIRSNVFETLAADNVPGRALLHPDKFTGGVFCASCFGEIRRIYEAGRVHIWDNLPTYFELPNWQDLKDT